MPFAAGQREIALLEKSRARACPATGAPASSLLQRLLVWSLPNDDGMRLFAFGPEHAPDGPLPRLARKSGGEPPHRVRIQVRRTRIWRRVLADMARTAWVASIASVMRRTAGSMQSASLQVHNVADGKAAQVHVPMC